MPNVLDYARSITHHRDHALVDKAMVYSLLDMFGRRRRRFLLRLYRIPKSHGQWQIFLTAWVDGRAVNCDEIECEREAVPPRMMEAMETGAVCAGTLADEQGKPLHFTWLPVCRDKEMLGCIEIGMERPLSQHQIALIDGMRGLYANYLSLLSYSQIDTLTKLFNRKTFDENLLQMLASVNAKTLAPDSTERRSEPQKHISWLAILDLDHFKRINDTFGHLFGDEVLIQVANLMRSIFRRKDKLFRFGGEEFVVLLRDTDERNAAKVFERFRLAVERNMFPQLSSVTVSIGATRVNPGDNPTILLGRADDALYFAKHHGRNQVQFFDDLMARGKIHPPTVLHTDAEMF